MARIYFVHLAFLFDIKADYGVDADVLLPKAARQVHQEIAWDVEHVKTC